MKSEYIPLIFIAVILGMLTVVGIMLYDLKIDREEKDDFCISNGYIEALSYFTEEIDGIEYLGCYNAQVINGELIETEEWFVFYGVSEKNE